jgi:hypothetical protein
MIQWIASLSSLIAKIPSDSQDIFWMDPQQDEPRVSSLSNPATITKFAVLKAGEIFKLQIAAILHSSFAGFSIRPF